MTERISGKGDRRVTHKLEQALLPRACRQGHLEVRDVKFDVHRCPVAIMAAPLVPDGAEPPPTPLRDGVRVVQDYGSSVNHSCRCECASSALGLHLILDPFGQSHHCRAKGARVGASERRSGSSH